VATVLTLAITSGYAWSSGLLNAAKWSKIMAVVQGLDVETMRAAAKAERDRADGVQPSLADLARARAARSRDLELREGAAASLLDELRAERIKLTEETSRYKRVKTEFETQLQQLRDSALATNEENVRLIIENIKPRQAKDQLMRMIRTQQMPAAVVLLASMPIAKRAKVIGEFKTDEESQKLAEMLKMIRESEPELELVDSARSKLEKKPSPP
jgi:hypothetical protein